MAGSQEWENNKQGTCFDIDFYVFCSGFAGVLAIDVPLSVLLQMSFICFRI